MKKFRHILQVVLAAAAIFVSAHASAQDAGIYVFQPIEPCSGADDAVGGRCQQFFAATIDRRLGGAWMTLNEGATVNIEYITTGGIWNRGTVTVTSGNAVISSNVTETSDEWEDFIEWLGGIFLGEDGDDFNGDGDGTDYIEIDGGEYDGGGGHETPPGGNHE